MLYYKKNRAYQHSGYKAELLYEPHGRRSSHWGKVSYQYTHSLIVRAPDGSRLFGLSLPNVYVDYVKQLVRVVALGQTVCRCCRKLSYLANKLYALRHTAGYFPCEHCGRFAAENSCGYTSDPPSAKYFPLATNSFFTPQQRSLLLEDLSAATLQQLRITLECEQDTERFVGGLQGAMLWLLSHGEHSSSMEIELL